jgi:hypothetical protein
MKGISNNLRDAIRAAGYASADVLARELKIGERTFRNYVNGRLPKDPEVFLLICRKLAISPNHYFGFETPDYQREAALIAEGLSEESRELWFQTGRIMSKK